MTKLPNFLVIGTVSAGTTSIYYYLRQHPQIYMSPVKEPRFFSYDGEKESFGGPKIKSPSVTDYETYCSLFRNVKDEIAIGEITPTYLYHPKSPHSIYKYIPDAKLIAILRNPVDRAYSNFLRVTKQGREPCTTFAQALEDEPERIKQNWSSTFHHKQVGFYAEQLARYYALFPKNQIKIFLYEDFCTKPTQIIKEIFEFLEVDSSFVPDIAYKSNVNGIPKNRFLYALISENPLRPLLIPFMPLSLRAVVSRLKNTMIEKPKLAPELRQQLIEDYREDINKLQHMLQRDLSTWLI